MDKNTILKDFQSKQRHIGSSYYTFASYCTNPNLRNDFLSFAREESNIIDWLSYEFDQNGENPTCAPCELISAAYQKFSSQSDKHKAPF